MPKRITLDQDYIDRIRKQHAHTDAQVEGLDSKKVPCKFCTFPTIHKYEDLQGHFSAHCSRCGQIAIYNAADYRRYSYRVFCAVTTPIRVAN